MGKKEALGWRRHPRIIELKMSVIPFFSKWRNWGLQRWGDLLKVTCAGNGRTRTGYYLNCSALSFSVTLSICYMPGPTKRWGYSGEQDRHDCCLNTTYLLSKKQINTYYKIRWWSRLWVKNKASERIENIGEWVKRSREIPLKRHFREEKDGALWIPGSTAGTKAPWKEEGWLVKGASVAGTEWARERQWEMRSEKGPGQIIYAGLRTLAESQAGSSWKF